MSSEAAKPTRPVAVMPTLTEALAAAAMPGQQQTLQSSLASLANLRSAFTPMMPQQAPTIYPEIALFSQFNQMFPGAAEMAQQQQMLRNAETANRGGRSKSGDTRSSSAYASRHQAAEQRRRTRINDRLDRLRQVVPHAERANTASFLEECITYIQNLQKRIAELEQLAGLTQATVSHPASTGLPGHLNMPVPAQISFPGAAQQPGATAMGRPINSQGPLDPPDARDPQASAGAARAAHYGLPAPQLQQPHTAQPGTPPAISGHGSDQAGGASPASSQGSMPLKKRSRPSA
ncbi:g3510 [Coccomyxa viridis]|uniref:G3510 protein n=1 Tax=Coccomyxa viridis TaxID=1274662 RepID=A0ABP1FMY7_9CHLO